MYLPYYFLKIYAVFMSITAINIIYSKYSIGNRKPCIRNMKKPK